MRIIESLFLSLAFIKVLSNIKAFKLKKNTSVKSKFRIINIEYYEMQLAFSLLIFFLIFIISLNNINHIGLYSALCALCNVTCLYTLEKMALRCGYISLNKK